ncbi:beta-1,4-glucuronyltransferase 1-like [Anoplophora glabripennis]|uniref:beta-1,4-glucuronyltransferase 1-like n=1 Tax=Anoplophora glabripennis TaxID=217634 RepID=UPI000874B6E6|nr:beta-1,4-glucuronyltransferase 1-like [Anoplophora glabripennis]
MRSQLRIPQHTLFLYLSHKHSAMFFNRRINIGFALVIASILAISTVLNSSYCPSYEVGNISVARSTIEAIVECEDVELEKKVKQRGQFLVFENYVLAETRFKCGDSITLTSPGDYRFLDNVVPLVERWEGPISVALYAPGSDFFTTLQCIAYLRTCTTPLVREFVTFHLFFEFEHMPEKENSSLVDIYEDTFDCNLKPPYEVLKDNDMYKEKNNLTYPINTARNIARTAAQTHFVFPSDIELYPTRNFIPMFLAFIRQHPEYAQKDAKNVFVLPIFEVRAGSKVPENKTHLHEMFEEKNAIAFHQGVCTPCHKIPGQGEWLNAEESSDLNVFNVTKRQGPHNIWEPFFVCTHREPLWDERLNWEGQGNKMSQVYALCIHDYDFMVLDNAFLIHKPGVKKKKVQVMKHMSEVVKNDNILRKIQKEMQNIFGPNKKCKIHNVF